MEQISSECTFRLGVLVFNGIRDIMHVMMFARWIYLESRIHGAILLWLFFSLIFCTSVAGNSAECAVVVIVVVVVVVVVDDVVET